MSIVGRYIVGQYLRVLGLCLTAVTGAFLIVDLVDRLPGYAEYNPTASAMLAFYAFRLPRILTDVYPAVSLLAVLLSLGLLAHRREIVALRACGIGTFQLSLPLLAASALISLAAFVWNEAVVPPTAAEARRIKDIVIKKKQDLGAYNARSIWFHDTQGFFNIDYFDATHGSIHGLTLYVAEPDFRLRRVIEVPIANWRDDRWVLSGGSVKEIAPDGSVRRRALAAGELRLADAPSDLAKKRPHAEEFSLFELRERIRVLQAKGHPADELRVDLQAKLAMPLSAVIGVLVGLPLAVRGGRRFGLTYNVTLGLVTGFAYWVTMALAVSAGRTGALPPIVAAWTADAVFATLGVLLLYTTADS